MKSHQNSPKGLVALVASFCVLLLIISACSKSNPMIPAVSSSVSAEIGADGGHLVLDQHAHLYIPAGAVTAPTLFELSEATNVPAPPPGHMQAGMAFSVTPAGGHYPDGVSVALQFDYPGYSDPDNLTGKMVQLSRLAADGSWQEIKDGGTAFPLGLGVVVDALGTFAAHIDTAAGDPDDPVADITLGSDSRFSPSSSSVLWRTRIVAGFSSPDGAQHFTRTGGPVQVGAYSLLSSDGIFYYLSYDRLSDEGAGFRIDVPAGSEVPALVDTAIFFPSELELSQTSPQGPEVNRQEALEIRWHGTGPELVWLTVYGDGIDGEFEFQGQMTPNDGLFVVSPEDLAKFSVGADVTVFLQHTQMRPIVAAGYHSASHVFIESDSLMKIIVN